LSALVATVVTSEVQASGAVRKLLLGVGAASAELALVSQEVRNEIQRARIAHALEDVDAQISSQKRTEAWLNSCYAYSA
jgi:hypothetical protein